MTICPAEPRWRSLLADEVPAAEAAALAAHLETCPGCQRTLDLCAADGRAWADVPRILAAPPDDPALHELIERLRHDPGPAADDPLDFLEPTTKPGSLGRLGPYEVLGEIGRGGMGIVLKALDPKLHRAVALKVLAPQLAVSAAARQRFTREARAAAAVCHPNVVAIHAVDEFRGLPYLVMQHVEGPSLHERIARDGPLPVDAVLSLGTQLAAGLAAAHARGLVHRDVKPANVLLDDGGAAAKLVDFGLARAADDVGLTRSGAIAGTPQYMAPEQADGRAVDARADLYALGAVLYFAAAGRPPFAGGHPLEVLRRARDERPAPLRTLNPTAPVWLEGVVMRLLAKHPGDRFASAAEVAALLERGLAHWRDPRHAPLPAALRTPPRRWHFALPALALLACAVVAGVVIKLQTAEGTLVVEIDDPAVKVKVDGSELVITGAGVQELRVKPGEHRVAATRDGKAVSDEVVTVTSGGKQVVRVTREAHASGPQKALELTLERDRPVALDMASKRVIHSAAAGRRDTVLVTLDQQRPGFVMVMPLKAGTDRITLTDVVGTSEVYSVTVVDPKGPPNDPEAGRRPANNAAQAQPAHANTSQEPLPAAEGKTVAPVRQWFTGHTSGGGKTPQQIHDTAVESFRRFDRNGDGFLHAAEASDRLPENWRQFDANGDGMLDRKEYEQCVRAFLDGQVRRGVAAMVLTPDGKTLVTAGHDGVVRVWDFATGTERSSRGATKRAAPALAMTGDGRCVIAGPDSTVSAFDPADGKGLWAYAAEVPLTCAAVSPDGKTVIVGGADGTYDSRVILLEAATGKFRSSAFVPATPTALAVIPVADPPRFTNLDTPGVTYAGGPAVVVAGGRAYEFRLERTGGAIDKAADPKGVVAVTYAAGLSATAFGTGVVWLQGQDVARRGNAQGLAQLRLSDGEVITLAFSPDGGALLTGEAGGRAKLWRVDDLKRFRTDNSVTLPGGSAPVRVVAFTPDGTQAVTAGDDGVIRVWAVPEAPRPPTPPPLPLPDGTVQPSVPAGRPPAVAAKSPREWDAQHARGVASLVIVPGGKLVATAGRDGKVKLWALPGGESRGEIAAHAAGPVALASDGRRLYTAGEDKAVIAWDLATRKQLWRCELKHPQAEVVAATAVAVSPDGKTVAAGGKILKDRGSILGGVALLDAADGTAVRDLVISQPVMYLAFAANGSDIDAVGDGSQIVNFDVPSGRRQSEFSMGATLNAYARSPAGPLRTVALAGTDHVNLLWGIGSFRTAFSPHGDGTVCLAFSPDGNVLLAAGRSGAIHLWAKSTLPQIIPPAAFEGRPLVALAAGNRPVRAAAFTPDGKSVVTAGDDGIVRVWAVPEILRPPDASGKPPVPGVGPSANGP